MREVPEEAMSVEPERPPTESGAQLARGVASIVVVGLLLGGAYNAIGQDARPRWGLDWIAKDKLDGLAKLPEDEAQPAADYRTDVTDPLAVPAHSGSVLSEIPDVGRPIQVESARLKQYVDAGQVVIVDAREPEEYAEGHLPGAINLPYDEVITDPARLEQLRTGGKAIVTYCGGGGCEISINLAEELIFSGHKRVLVLVGGFPDWLDAGYPIESSPEGR